jgi:hypothetical protein
VDWDVQTYGKLLEIGGGKERYSLATATTKQADECLVKLMRTACELCVESVAFPSEKHVLSCPFLKGPSVMGQVCELAHMSMPQAAKAQNW